MAKGLRSKTKQAFKRARRATLVNEEIAVKREHDIQSVLERVLAQGEAYQATREAEREVEAANAPQAMDSAEPTATDTQDVQQPTATGRASLAKKIRKGRRVKQVRAGVSGMNQFHPKQKKGRKRKQKYNPGYTLTTSLG